MVVVAEMQHGGVGFWPAPILPLPMFSGSSLHDELQSLVEAGLTPLEALQSASLRPAEFLHTTRDSGTIERGKYADLVLRRQPSRRIRNTGKIAPSSCVANLDRSVLTIPRRRTIRRRALSLDSGVRVLRFDLFRLKRVFQLVNSVLGGFFPAVRPCH